MEARGKVNCYVQEAQASKRKVFYTINLAAGTTPFMKMFDGIMCQSGFYRLMSQQVDVTHAWYRPTVEVFKSLPDWEDHILNGGLHFDTLEMAVKNQLPDDPVDHKWEYERFQEFVLKTYGKRLGPLENPTGNVSS